MFFLAQIGTFWNLAILKIYFFTNLKFERALFEMPKLVLWTHPEILHSLAAIESRFPRSTRSFAWLYFGAYQLGLFFSHKSSLLKSQFRNGVVGTRKHNLDFGASKS